MDMDVQGGELLARGAYMCLCHTDVSLTLYSTYITSGINVLCIPYGKTLDANLL